MKSIKSIALAGALVVACGGCATKGGWPCWAWQKNTDQKNERAGEKYLANQTPAPENPSVLLLGGSDLSHDIVSTNSSGEVTRIHEGWVYRFYPNGGIDSITQKP